MELTNKRILVTGASSGIGQALAIACAEKGVRVVVHYRSNERGAKETLREVESHV